MNAVSKNLKAIRRAKGLTQDQLAEMLHVTWQAVNGSTVCDSHRTVPAHIPLCLEHPDQPLGLDPGRAFSRRLSDLPRLEQKNALS